MAQRHRPDSDGPYLDNFFLQVPEIYAGAKFLKRDGKINAFHLGRDNFTHRQIISGRSEDFKLVPGDVKRLEKG